MKILMMMVAKMAARRLTNAAANMAKAGTGIAKPIIKSEERSVWMLINVKNSPINNVTINKTPKTAMLFCFFAISLLSCVQ